jgi:hypothetical protein
MYNNIGKRDILIFPKFDNIDIINEVRNKYDRLANLVNPHITLVQADGLKDFSDFNYEFTTVINKVSVEFIVENEESIIIKNIKLGE